MMKKFFSYFVALAMLCLSVNAYGLTANQAKRLSNPRLQSAMRALSNDELCAFCNEVFSGSDRMLQSRVKIQLQNLLRRLPAGESRALMVKLNTQVPQLNFAVRGDGTVVVVESTGDSSLGSGTYVPRGDGDSKPVSRGATNTAL